MAIRDLLSLLSRASLGGASAAVAGLGLLSAALFSSGSLAADPYLRISDDDCRRLIRHSPSADVAYQPGVDVRGKAVAPANLNANEPGGQPELIMPRFVLIPIEVDLFDRFGLPPDGETYEADAFIGEVTVDLVTGEAFFNGQPLQDEAQAELAARCREGIRNRSGGN